MKRFLLYICSLMMVISLAACGDSDDKPVDAASIRVVFQVYVPSATQVSRADDDPEETGEEWESAIRLDKLHVVLYAKDGTSIGGLEHVSLIRTSNPNMYDVVGSILVNKLNLVDGKLDGTIAVYANMDAVDETASFDEQTVNRLTFQATTSQQHAIPMWGIKRLNIPMQAGAQTQIGTINLLRAEAKIQLFLRDDEQMKNYEIGSVSLSRVNTAGYCLPQFANIKAIKDVQELEHDAFCHFLSSDSPQTDVDMSQGAIYVPEYENRVKVDGAADTYISREDAAVINLKLMDKRDHSEKEYRVPFVEYDAAGAPTSQPVDIVRDHYYKFEVYLSSDDMLKVNLKVRKWYYVKHDEILM